MSNIYIGNIKIEQLARYTPYGGLFVGNNLVDSFCNIEKSKVLRVGQLYQGSNPSVWSFSNVKLIQNSGRYYISFDLTCADNLTNNLPKTISWKYTNIEGQYADKMKDHYLAFNNGSTWTTMRLTNNLWEVKNNVDVSTKKLHIEVPYYYVPNMYQYSIKYASVRDENNVTAEDTFKPMFTVSLTGGDTVTFYFMPWNFVTGGILNKTEYTLRPMLNGSFTDYILL